MRFRKGTAKNREILRENKHFAAVDQTVSGDDAIARKFLFLQAKVSRAMDNEFVELLETAFVQEKLYALARRHFARRTLLFYSLLTAALFGRQ